MVQVRFHTELDRIFHVKTDHNPSGIGTRPSKVKDEDIGPESIWENGHDWMRGHMEEAVEAHVLTPAKDLRLQTDEKEAFDHGLVFEKCPEILVKGHSTFTTTRLDKMKIRAEFSNYIFQPTKFKVVRITASIFAFLRNIGFSKKSETKFRMFLVRMEGASDVKTPKLIEENFEDYFNAEKSEFAKEKKILRNLGAPGLLVYVGVLRSLSIISKEEQG